MVSRITKDVSVDLMAIVDVRTYLTKGGGERATVVFQSGAERTFHDQAAAGLAKAMDLEFAREF